MADTYWLIKWKDVNDKVLNDPSKYEVINGKEDVTNPSLIGLQPDLEYFAKRVPFQMPSIDIRLSNMTEARVMTEDIEVSSNCRYYDLIYQLTQRSNDEKKVSVAEIEEVSNLRVFPTKKQLKYTMLYNIIARRESRGLNISPEQQLILDKYEAKGLRVWQNHIEGISKGIAIDTGTPFDIDANWEIEDNE